MRPDSIKTAGTRSHNCCPLYLAGAGTSGVRDSSLKQNGPGHVVTLSQDEVETFDLPLAKTVTAHML